MKAASPAKHSALAVMCGFQARRTCRSSAFSGQVKGGWKRSDLVASPHPRAATVCAGGCQLRTARARPPARCPLHHPPVAQSHLPAAPEDPGSQWPSGQFTLPSSRLTRIMLHQRRSRGRPALPARAPPAQPSGRACKERRRGPIHVKVGACSGVWWSAGEGQNIPMSGPLPSPLRCTDLVVQLLCGLHDCVRLDGQLCHLLLQRWHERATLALTLPAVRGVPACFQPL